MVLSKYKKPFKNYNLYGVCDTLTYLEFETGSQTKYQISLKFCFTNPSFEIYGKLGDDHLALIKPLYSHYTVYRKGGLASEIISRSGGYVRRDK